MTNPEIIWGNINGWQYGRVTFPKSARNGEAFARSIKTGETVYIGCFLGDMGIARDEARERGFWEARRPNGLEVWDRR